MAGDDNGHLPDQHALAAAFQDGLLQAPLPDWPVFGLADSDMSGWLCGGGQTQAGVDAIRVDYRPPFGDERLIVQTQKGQPRLDLGGVLRQLQAGVDEGEPISAADSPTVPSDPSLSSMVMIIVDGEPVSATTQQAGSATVYAAAVRGVTVIVGTRLASLDVVRLNQIRDLEPFKAARRRIIERL